VAAAEALAALLVAVAVAAAHRKRSVWFASS